MLTSAAGMRRLDSLPARITIGAFGGFLAGIAFIALTAWLTTETGKPALAPFQLISTIVLGPAAVKLGTASIVLGEVIHSVLSAILGAVFAVLTQPVRRNNGLLAAAGLLYGGIVYAVDFQIFARFVHQFSALMMANQPFELTVHLFFGALLALFLMRPGRRVDPAGPVDQQTPPREPAGL